MHGFIKQSNTKWYLNSDCSNYITEGKTLFSFFDPKKRGFISYGDNKEERIIFIGIVGKFPNLTIKEVLLVDGLK